MPGFFTDYVNNKVLDLVLGGVAFTAPAIYAGLSTTNAIKSGVVNEPSGNGYARVAVTNNLTNFPAALTGSKANGTVIQFPTLTGTWGTITTLFFVDAASNGDILAMIDFPTPKTWVTGNSPAVGIGALNLSHT